MALSSRTPARHETPTLHAGMLDAEYTVVQSFATREWVAVGTVRAAEQPLLAPAWLLVGTGKTAPEAVADLKRRLEDQAERRALGRLEFDVEL